MMKGYERVPELYGELASTVQPGSIGAFHFDRLYFCSQALKQEAEQAGFRVGHAEVIYPGIATEKFWAEPKPANYVPKKFLIVPRLTRRKRSDDGVAGLKLAREHEVACEPQRLRTGRVGTNGAVAVLCHPA